MIKITENQTIDIKNACVNKKDILDLYRLQKQLLEEENIVASLDECANIWCRYSEDLCAGWLFFPKYDKDILKHISSSDFFTSYEDYSK